jgi:hypothetical protein
MCDECKQLRKEVDQRTAERDIRARIIRRQENIIKELIMKVLVLRKELACQQCQQLRREADQKADEGASEQKDE